ncbi:hypothetical protein BJ912DRAFT_1070088 [Pholiota molesta]|nr:hypothetical protein BJ912DRAFT_1070088 [Pholiota molesta]
MEDRGRRVNDDDREQWRTTRDEGNGGAREPREDPGAIDGVDVRRARNVDHRPDSPSFHSASTTLLIDDSPAKAALQPWNQLCIRDYVQGMRNLNLLVVEREARACPNSRHRHRIASTQHTNDDGGVQKVMVDGALVGWREEVVHRVLREAVMIDGHMVAPDKAGSTSLSPLLASG